MSERGFVSIPDAKKVFFGLEEPGAYGGQPAQWDEAMAAMPYGHLPFLDKATLPKRVQAIGLASDRVVLLSAVADLVEANENLRCFAWYLHWRIFIAPDHGIPWGAPSLVKRLGDRAGLFYLLLSLEWEPCLRAYHRLLGYPPDVTDETLEQLCRYEENHLRGRGFPGIYENQLPWLATYLKGPYVKLGRFEYQLHSYGGGVSAWRREKDGALLTLAEDGQRLDENGLQRSDSAPEGTGWTASLKEEPDVVQGYPIAPTGYVLHQQVCLPRSEWKPYLKAGDTVLELHIPSGGRMDWDSMVSSLKKATGFFAKHHPEQSWRALVVTTWFMDPRLAGILGTDSNPVKLQRAVYLYPTRPDPDSLWFIFLHPVSKTDPDKLPNAMSIQRKLIEFLKTGQTWNGGGFLMLPEDVADPCLDAYRPRVQALFRELSITLEAERFLGTLET